MYYTLYFEWRITQKHEELISSIRLTLVCKTLQHIPLTLIHKWFAVFHTVQLYISEVVRPGQ